MSEFCSFHSMVNVDPIVFGAIYYTWFPRGPYFREKCLFWNMGVPALEKSLLLNIFDKSPGKVLIFNRWMINIVSRKLRFSQVLHGNDIEFFGNPLHPLTNHWWCVVWRHLVPAKIPCASFIKFYYVVTESQSAHTWCHMVVVCNLIGPQSRRYTWRTLCKTSSIFVEIRQHNQDRIPQINGVYISCILKHSDKMNKQTKTLSRCKKIQSGILLITTCLCVADRRGDQSFPGHGLRPKIFV